jgi:peroxiredoxin
MYQNIHRYSSGSMAPAFALHDRNGKEVTLAEYKGKVVYLAFWATWCGACQRKMALMKDAERDFADRNPEVVFIHVSLDKNTTAWQSTIAFTNYPGLHLNSPDGPVGALAKTFGISALPEYYIISRNGAFAEKPASHDIEELFAVLTDLTKGK